MLQSQQSLIRTNLCFTLILATKHGFRSSHELQIYSDLSFRVDSELIPTGQKISM